MTVRVRGIYATALTELLREEPGVAQPSPTIAERFDADFGERATASVETTGDRQGVGVIGDANAVETVVARLTDLGRDALAWVDPAPRGAVFAGEVAETLGSGAVVDLGERAGFLPYGKTDRRIDEGDRLRVQVRDPRPPWIDERPVLDTTLRVQGSLATLVRGESGGGTGAPELADLLSADPREGWRVTWERAADEAGLDALGDALAAANERAAAIESAVDGIEADEAAPREHHGGTGTTWVWFGRESRFALDEHRRAVTATMPGHHRTKAADERASAAVDFAEALAPDLDGEFPFAVVARQFGPREGETVAIRHGKPDGRCFSLGRATVTDVDADGSVTLERELSSRGTYDGLGTEREPGDVAETKIREGRWWYPTVYRSADGDLRGTYVNVCTPVEAFPDAVRYVDLHVDVVKRPDGSVERVDDDELDAAVAAGDVSEALAEKARSVAASVEQALS
ncbi:MAG: DUF402 domain-containing protein [Haloarculaceae archaeon]